MPEGNTIFQPPCSVDTSQHSHPQLTACAANLQKEEHSFAQLSGASSVVPALGGSELACVSTCPANLCGSGNTLTASSVSAGFWNRCGQLETVRNLSVPTFPRLHNKSVDTIRIGCQLFGLKLDKSRREDSWIYWFDPQRFLVQ